MEKSYNLPQIMACFDAKNEAKRVILRPKMIGMTWKNGRNVGLRYRKGAEEGTEMVFLFLFDDAAKC